MLPDSKREVRLTFDEFYLLELRKILWKNGKITLSEFFSFVSQLLVTGDRKIHLALNEIKQARAKNQLIEIVHTDEQSLYDLIEQKIIERRKQENKKLEK